AVLETRGRAVHPVVKLEVGESAVAPDDGRLVGVIDPVQREDQRGVSSALGEGPEPETKAREAEIEEHPTLRRDPRKGACAVRDLRNLGGLGGRRRSERTERGVGAGRRERRERRKSLDL